MFRLDAKKPFSIGSQIFDRRNKKKWTIKNAINCTPLNKECFWDYLIQCGEGKKAQEKHIDSNHLCMYYTVIIKMKEKK